MLTVPKYDFHWQLAYELDTPLRLPAGSKLVVTAHYDNSSKNDLLRLSAKDPARNCGPDREAYFRKQNQSWDEMFSPLIQYSLDNENPTKLTSTAQARHVAAETTNVGQQRKPQKQSVLDIVQAVGCLARTPAGTWVLANASDPIITETQTTSSAELNATTGKPFGNHQYQLLGAGVFNPQSHGGQKVAVKGVLINSAGDSRLNVTSLQAVAPSCF